MLRSSLLARPFVVFTPVFFVLLCTNLNSRSSVIGALPVLVQKNETPIPLNAGWVASNHDWIEHELHNHTFLFLVGVERSGLKFCPNLTFTCSLLMVVPVGTSLTKRLFDRHPNVSGMFNNNFRENEGWPRLVNSSLDFQIYEPAY